MATLSAAYQSLPSGMVAETTCPTTTRIIANPRAASTSVRRGVGFLGGISWKNALSSLLVSPRFGSAALVLSACSEEAFVSKSGITVVDGLNPPFAFVHDIHFADLDDGSSRQP